MSIKQWKLILIDEGNKTLRFHTAAELFRYVDMNKIERCVVDGPPTKFQELYKEFNFKPECSKVVH